LIQVASVTNHESAITLSTPTSHDEDHSPDTLPAASLSVTAQHTDDELKEAKIVNSLSSSAKKFANSPSPSPRSTTSSRSSRSRHHPHHDTLAEALKGDPQLQQYNHQIQEIQHDIDTKEHWLKGNNERIEEARKSIQHQSKVLQKLHRLVLAQKNLVQKHQLEAKLAEVMHHLSTVNERSHGVVSETKALEKKRYDLLQEIRAIRVH